MIRQHLAPPHKRTPSPRPHAPPGRRVLRLGRLGCGRSRHRRRSHPAAVGDVEDMADDVPAVGPHVAANRLALVEEEECGDFHDFVLVENFRAVRAPVDHHAGEGSKTGHALGQRHHRREHADRRAAVGGGHEDGRQPRALPLLCEGRDLLHAAEIFHEVARCGPLCVPCPIVQQPRPHRVAHALHPLVLPEEVPSAGAVELDGREALDADGLAQGLGFVRLVDPVRHEGGALAPLRGAVHVAHRVHALRQYLLGGFPLHFVMDLRFLDIVRLVTHGPGHHHDGHDATPGGGFGGLKLRLACDVQHRLRGLRTPCPPLHLLILVEPRECLLHRRDVRLQALGLHAKVAGQLRLERGHLGLEALDLLGARGRSIEGERLGRLRRLGRHLGAGELDVQGGDSGHEGVQLLGLRGGGGQRGLLGRLCRHRRRLGANELLLERSHLCHEGLELLASALLLERGHLRLDLLHLLGARGGGAQRGRSGLLGSRRRLLRGGDVGLERGDLGLERLDLLGILGGGGGGLLLKRGHLRLDLLHLLGARGSGRFRGLLGRLRRLRRRPGIGGLGLEGSELGLEGLNLIGEGLAGLGLEGGDVGLQGLDLLGALGDLLRHLQGRLGTLEIGLHAHHLDGELVEVHLAQGRGLARGGHVHLQGLRRLPRRGGIGEEPRHLRLEFAPLPRALHLERLELRLEGLGLCRAGALGLLHRVDILLELRGSGIRIRPGRLRRLELCGGLLVRLAGGLKIALELGGRGGLGRGGANPHDANGRADGRNEEAPPAIQRRPCRRSRRRTWPLPALDHRRCGRSLHNQHL
mmetsp:Transcript_13870/g.43964  ORF Transcript_13870/g.43964 Transcript_13870/m.43964 type:complete len:809 (+) Transcript_13870:168-2594(+)